MRIIFFTLFLWLLSTTIFGQAYTSFIDTNSIWREVIYGNYSHGPSFISYDTWDVQERLGGDTIINKKYSKVYRTGFKRHYMYDHGHYVDTTYNYCYLYIGALREDSLKHVYFRFPNGIEQLLFNFNLKLGDTLQSCRLQYQYDKPLIVASIDSVYVFDKYRKRFILTGNVWDNDTLNLIEGIGTDLGLLGALNSRTNYTGNLDYLISYFYKNTKAYKGIRAKTSKDLINCNDFTAVNFPELSENYKLFPNPASGFIYIQSSNINTTQKKVYILNNVGHSLYSHNIDSELEPLDISFLKNGIYFIKIIDSRGSMVVDKFIKATQ